MHSFDQNIASLLQSLVGSPDSASSPTITIATSDQPEEITQQDDLKSWIADYVSTNSELSEDDPNIKQILNAVSIDQIESFLRGNLDYCDECFMKMYRNYAIEKSGFGDTSPSNCC